MRIPAAVLMLLLCAPALAQSLDDPLARWVDVRGTTIHYLDTGSTEPATAVLLMVHGWCGSSEDFRPLIAGLPAGLRSIAVDLPGSGLSAKPDAAYDLPFFLDFLWAFHETLGLNRVILVGHSLGGQLAIHFTALHPEVVQKLVLIDPAGLEGEAGRLEALPRLGPLVDLGFLLNNRTFIEWAVRGNVLYHPTQEMVDAVVDSTARGILGSEGARAAARVTRNVIGRGPVEQILSGIQQETLVVWGDHDVLLPTRWAAKFAELLPHATLGIVAESGHMPMVEKPMETARLVAGFLGP